jgi:DNA helicase IV
VSVAGPEGGPDPELRAEQDYLDRSHEALSRMRSRAEGVVEDVRGAGSPDLDYLAALVHRVHVLADSPRPLLFGRIDEDAGASWHIGRRHVEDRDGDPLVVDWRAPVAMPFYRARAEDPFGLRRQRQVTVDRRRVIAVADDLFGPAVDPSTTRLRGGDALLADLERGRTGEMLDIVATIQAEQDEIIRAPLDQLTAVQGGPGTGKTAVGLHRAAYLLYNHPALSRFGILVIGPSRAFLRYISHVLPSLGEEAVIQTTIADIAPHGRVRVEDPLELQRVKGDPRMAQVLARALRQRRTPAEDDVRVGARAVSTTLPADLLNDLVHSIAERPGPYKAGRGALRSRLVALVRQQLRQSGHLEANEPWLEREVSSSASFKALLDHLWPAVSPATLVREVLSDRGEPSGTAAGVLTAHERAVLRVNAPRRSSTAAWSVDDLALLDEAEFLINGRAHTYGHVVIDEAQDLSPMQFRMIARRTPSGSITVLGDLAQATGAWTYDDWDEILRFLPDAAPVHKDELTLGYRAPGTVLDLASRLLQVAAPNVNPTRSIRTGTAPPHVLPVEPEQLLTESVGEALRLAGEESLVGLVVAPSAMAGFASAVRGSVEIGTLDRDGMTKPVTLVSALEVKGLEFDSVVVVEPGAIAGTDVRGLRLLYVAMTRPIRRLSIVHADPLPDLLIPPPSTTGAE